MDRILYSKPTEPDEVDGSLFEARLVSVNATHQPQVDDFMRAIGDLVRAARRALTEDQHESLCGVCGWCELDKALKPFEGT